VRVRGSLERREGTINVLASELRVVERPDLPLADVREIEPPVGRETGRDEGAAGESIPSLDEARRAREVALAELRAVAPPAHSFGRRGR
jgi:hypothetical protein